MKKLIFDTITNSGIYSQKRIMTFASFLIATIYAFLPLVSGNFDVKEFVFLGFIGAGGFSLYRTQKVNDNTGTNSTGDGGLTL